MTTKMIIRVVVDRHLDDGVERVGALENVSARCSTACCRIDRQPSTSHAHTLTRSTDNGTRRQRGNGGLAGDGQRRRARGQP